MAAVYAVTCHLDPVCVLSPPSKCINKDDQTPDTNEHIALFIDADNAPASKIDVIIAELAKYGVAHIRKAYGNWKNGNLSGWENVLHDYAISPVQQFDLSKGKNTTDMAMTIDAMDVMYGKSVETFCIVSSDCDFTPLVMRLRAEGKRVIGFGERKAPAPFVNSCTPFLYLTDLEKESSEPNQPGHEPTQPAKGNELKGNSQLMNLLRGAIEASQDDGGWANLGQVGSHISNQSSFDALNYGYTKLGDLVRAIDLFTTKVAPNGCQVFVKNERRT